MDSEPGRNTVQFVPRANIRAKGQGKTVSPVPPANTDTASRGNFFQRNFPLIYGGVIASCLIALAVVSKIGSDYDKQEEPVFRAFIQEKQHIPFEQLQLQKDTLFQRFSHDAYAYHARDTLEFLVKKQIRSEITPLVADYLTHGMDVLNRSPTQAKKFIAEQVLQAHGIYVGFGGYNVGRSLEAHMKPVQVKYAKLASVDGFLDEAYAKFSPSIEIKKGLSNEKIQTIIKEEETSRNSLYGFLMDMGSGLFYTNYHQLHESNKDIHTTIAGLDSQKEEIRRAMERARDEKKQEVNRASEDRIKHHEDVLSTRLEQEVLSFTPTPELMRLVLLHVLYSEIKGMVAFDKEMAMRDSLAHYQGEEVSTLVRLGKNNEKDLEAYKAQAQDDNTRALERFNRTGFLALEARLADIESELSFQTNMLTSEREAYQTGKDRESAFIDYVAQHRLHENVYGTFDNDRSWYDGLKTYYGLNEQQAKAVLTKKLESTFYSWSFEEIDVMKHYVAFRSALEPLISANEVDAIAKPYILDDASQVLKASKKKWEKMVVKKTAITKTDLHPAGM